MIVIPLCVDKINVTISLRPFSLLITSQDVLNFQVPKVKHKQNSKSLCPNPPCQNSSILSADYWRAVLPSHIICMWTVCIGLGCVCVCGCVCLSHTLAVIYSSSHTLPFCLLVNCHGEGGFNDRLQRTINLDTSYHCLPLQGEACPVANVINPLPLSRQPPTHTLQTPSSFPQQEAMLQGEKKLHTSEARNLPDLAIPFLHRKYIIKYNLDSVLYL